MSSDEELDEFLRRTDPANSTKIADDNNGTEATGVEDLFD